MDNRRQDSQAFLDAAGWGDAERRPLAGDASFRKYERLWHKGQQAVLMDAPPPHEDVRPFLRACKSLRSHGLSAPALLAADEEKGFLLLEDLGDNLYSRLLKDAPHKEEELYLAAADVLVKLYQEANTTDSTHYPPYDSTLLMREAMLLPEWFLTEIYDPDTAISLGQEYARIWQGLFSAIPSFKPVLVQRDFHADNLLWLQERKGVTRVGLLDFQDAVIGAPAYDMVSILEDARRDVSQQTVQAVLNHYLEQTGQDRQAFMDSYALLGAQRNCKIVGIFARLAKRDGKHGYLAYMPRVWGHLQQDVMHPLLLPLKSWLDKHIPVSWRGAITISDKKKQAQA